MLTPLYISAGICILCSMLSFSYFTAGSGGHGAGIGNGFGGLLFLVCAVISFLVTYVLGTIAAFVYAYTTLGTILVAIPALLILFWFVMGMLRK